MICDSFTLPVPTRNRCEFVDITADINRMLKQNGFLNGICVVFSPHTTAGITINENADRDVQRDIIAEMAKIVPFDDGYAHLEGNSAAHIKTLMTGVSVSVPVSGGQLELGVWQGVYFCEFDGARSRTCRIRFVGEKRGGENGCG